MAGPRFLGVGGFRTHTSGNVGPILVSIDGTHVSVDISRGFATSPLKKKCQIDMCCRNHLVFTPFLCRLYHIALRVNHQNRYIGYTGGLCVRVCVCCVWCVCGVCMRGVYVWCVCMRDVCGVYSVYMTYDGNVSYLEGCVVYTYSPAGRQTPSLTVY